MAKHYINPTPGCEVYAMLACPVTMCCGLYMMHSHHKDVVSSHEQSKQSVTRIISDANDELFFPRGFQAQLKKETKNVPYNYTSKHGTRRTGWKVAEFYSIELEFITPVGQVAPVMAQPVTPAPQYGANRAQMHNM